MRIHVDTLFALGGRIYRPGPADAPDDVAKWAIGRGYARALDAAPAAPEAAPENKAHAAAPKRAVKPGERRDNRPKAEPGGHKCPNARATWCAGKA